MNFEPSELRLVGATTLGRGISLMVQRRRKARGREAAFPLSVAAASTA
jgi:hypothetical protein